MDFARLSDAVRSKNKRYIVNPNGRTVNRPLKKNKVILFIVLIPIEAFLNFNGMKNFWV